MTIVWDEWANGLPGSTPAPEDVKQEDDDCSIEFLDLTYLHDAPAALVC